MVQSKDNKEMINDFNIKINKLEKEILELKKKKEILERRENIHIPEKRKQEQEIANDIKKPRKETRKQESAYYQEHLQLLIEDTIDNMIQHLEKEHIVLNLKKELKLHIQRIEEIRKKYN